MFTQCPFFFCFRLNEQAQAVKIANYTDEPWKTNNHREDVQQQNEDKDFLPQIFLNFAFDHTPFATKHSNSSFFRASLTRS